MVVQRSILLVGTIAGALLAAPAFAQQPPASAPPATPPAAAQPLPPGSPLIGRPEGNAAAAKLAPVASPPLPAPADKLPTAKLKLPAGFNVEVYASGIANTRSLRVGDKGTVFVGTRFGNKVTAIVKKDGKTEIKTVAEGLYRPNGLAIHKGALYIAELSQVSKIENIENVLDKPPKPTVIYTDLPKDEAHGWKFIGIPTASSTFRSGSRATMSCTTRITARFAASISTAADERTSRSAFATQSVSTGIR